eukprot:TRINITY_DN14797_c0_g1_i2.p1 TRINITY_DN14797_c0_g1~~TRINITY_DN14797_c0_g1_i2.p1  ORF type:complete len:176 (-),score=20.70 TRINITY_DN14797_c0_g1_i2:355-882(-)
MQHKLKKAYSLVELPALARGDCILMKNTRLSNTFICQRQQRNMHGRIFGGFLMRRAYELAFATAYKFGGSRPQFAQVDKVQFECPVDVGKMLGLDSMVINTENATDFALMTIEVVANVIEPETVSSLVTNTFVFTFRVSYDEMPEQLRASGGLKQVLPSNEDEVLKLWKCTSNQN